MKYIIILTTLFAATYTTNLRADSWIDSYDTLLQKYVSDGGVKYQAWHGNKDDLAALKSVVDAISTADLSSKSEDEQLAFYLNAYNAWILHTMLEAYPTEGPGGGGFFGRNKYFKAKTRTVAGNETSFHLLENEIIRPKFKEPRIHFALNCASRSCPPLHDRAFRGENLDTTLDMLTKAFINDNPNGVQPSKSGKSVEVSKIFDWYADDFAGGVLTYIKPYRADPIADDAKVIFQKYHWTINEAK